jgi:preprotein translocase subunit YajC
MSLLVAEAVAQTAAGGAPEGAGYMNFVLLGGLFVFMYFLIIRPQRKRRKEHKSLVDTLAKGNEVVLSSGMLGKIVEVDEDYVTIKAAESVQLRFQKSSIHAVLPKGTLKGLDK